MWTLGDHFNQAAEFGYVRTPGHNAGCQCLECSDTGRMWAVDHLTGLYHLPRLAFSVVLVPDPDNVGRVRFLLPWGGRSVSYEPGLAASIIRETGYVKIGGW